MTLKLSILFALLFSGFAALCQNIEFVENRGQWDAQIKYAGRVSSGAFLINRNGFTVVQHDTADLRRIGEARHGHRESNVAARKGGPATDELVLKSHAYRVEFLGGATAPQVIADKPLNTYNNYFIGNDPSKWASNCKIYQGITVKDVYPNVDVRYYTGQGSLKYDIIVHPGGDPSRIALKYEGTEGLDVKSKELRIKTPVGDLKEREPYTYQYNESGRVTLKSFYSVKDNVVRFSVKDYDPKTTLVIDPDLIFCSFSGSAEDNWGFTATNGPDGSMFGGGIVFGSGFPTTGGSFQTGFGGGTSSCFGAGYDIGIIKLSSDGRSRIFATYIGGSGNEMPESLIVDPQGELIVMGRSNSSNYPTTGANGVLGGGGYDIVVTKLNAAGTALVGSKKIGGKGEDGTNIAECSGSGPSSLLRNYGDEGRGEVNLDAAGNVYVASCTRSQDSSFYTLNAVQRYPGGGGQDGVVLKFDPTVSNLLFSTYFGGKGDDAAYVLALHPQTGNIYVAGGTASDSLPGRPAAGVVGPNYNGNIDGFVTVLTPDGASIVTTSYFGTTGLDQIYGLQFDLKGFPYIMGQTSGPWPVQNAAWSQNGGKQFIAKLQPDLSAYVYSTVFGKGQARPDISPVAFLVDRCENVYISGWGGKIGNSDWDASGVLGLPVTPDALKSVPDPGRSGSGEDFYFFVLKKDAVSQLYGSFFGQNNGAFPDHVDGGTSRFDKNGVIYQAICGACNTDTRQVPFPTTQGVWAKEKPLPPTCNLAMVKIAFNFAGTKGEVRASINGVPRDTVGCVPLTVDFVDTIQVASQYEWDFGDGSPTVRTTQPSLSHTYTQIGIYRVMLVAIDSSKCFPRDTTYTTIKVGNNRATPQFRAVKLSPPCDIFRYRFDNTSLAPPGIPFRGQGFTWDFGDNSPSVTTGPAPVFHTYATAGSYIVKLTLSDTSYCNSPETVVDTVRVAANVKAVFATPSKGCAPYDAFFSNQSVGGSQFIWDFGDGTTATSPPASPTHRYNNPGTYVVTLTAIDSNTCNIIDRTSFTINVAAAPTADFSFAPSPPTPNTPITFTNLSSPDAIRFKWVWGDGDSLFTASRGLIQHEFNLTGKYNTCLTAYNAAGCEAKRCQDVSSLADPAIDVPNAFTPQSGDVNSRIFVKGYGITKLKFAIYARWGEKVFETEDKRVGWDGRYKGQLLPMDAYAYTLEAELADGRKVRKTGDITLIR